MIRTATAPTSADRCSGDQAVRELRSHQRCVAPGRSELVAAVGARPSAGSLGGLPGDLNDLFAVAYDDRQGTRAHQLLGELAGIGSQSHRTSAESEQLRSSRDAPRSWPYCFAAGNDGIDENANGIVDAGLGQPA